MEEEFIEHYQKKQQTKPEEENVFIELFRRNSKRSSNSGGYLWMLERYNNL